MARSLTNMAFRETFDCDCAGGQDWIARPPGAASKPNRRSNKESQTDGARMKKDRLFRKRCGAKRLSRWHLEAVAEKIFTWTRAGWATSM